MLQVRNICKTYVTGDLVQTALDGVSLNFRDNEFVAVLGPSGSGKTTLLNVIGGLDRYDSGDLIINGISTKKYKDRDWDSYRNHTIGFVFQSYNLIPHQSVLANVELALTISGISRSERRKRAARALEQVGLGNQLHKKPNQMSGGQMQRVAIARALINNPNILLADEPTGALDTETSVQVMDLLREVAKDRLVVMVTHNPELAETYANRIVRLRDGKITDDSNPYEPEEAVLSAPVKHKNMGRSSMSFLTALSLSFNNLKTKKARTLLTSFAGSIGIIGIALILSLSNGVSNYISDIQKSTMTSYPITIQAEAIDLSSMISEEQSDAKSGTEEHTEDRVYSNGKSLERASRAATSLTKNNLTDFKKYLDSEDSAIRSYIGEKGIVYSYEPKFSVFSYDSEGTLVNSDGSTLSESGSASETSRTSAMSVITGTSSSTNNFEELTPGANGESIGAAVTDTYSLVYGSWPQAYDEVVLVLNQNNEISATALYELGLLPTSEYRELQKKISNGDEITVPEHDWDYADICSHTFQLISACDMYQKNSSGTFTSLSGDTGEIQELLRTSSVSLKITGIIRPIETSSDESSFTSASAISSPVGYTRALTDYLISRANDSEVVNAQKASPETNVLSGVSFSPADDSAKADDAKTYLSGLSVTAKAKMYREILQSVSPESASSLNNLGETQLAAMLDEYLENPSQEVLLRIYNAYISPGTYEDNMKAFGAVSLDAPSEIRIYVDSFEDKNGVTQCIKDYNASASEDNQITYTDYVGLLMNSVTKIVNIISYVLIAFVSVSLIVSSIMIGIITYISVLERTKEIGILRAIGASRHNISEVFNAETFIVGLCAGLIGIGLTLLILIPGNMLIHTLASTNTINASLPLGGALLLVILSVFLTLLAGLIPSRKAAKKDPVMALRTE